MGNVVIIGAGECGVRAAFSLREQGFEGEIALLSEESSFPYERPPLSKGGGVVKPICNATAYKDARIELQLGNRAEAIDVCERRVALTDGRSLAYDQLLLATGARPRLFPTIQGCLTLRTDADSTEIFSHFGSGLRIGIIGGGFIGLELASAAQQAGAEVTVVEAAPRVLARAVPEEIASVVHAHHTSKGVTIITETGVSRASSHHIALSDGRELQFDSVVAGVGAIPNTELAEAAGLNVENGIVVDATFRTSDPNIFAAGDCCTFIWQGKRVRLESWKAAQDQGDYVATAMLGKSTGYARVPWFWSDQFDLILQVTGLFNLTREVHRRNTTRDTCVVFQCDSDGIVCAAAGIGMGNAAAKEIKVFEKLIERSISVQPLALASSSFDLKQLLRV